MGNKFLFLYLIIILISCNRKSNPTLATYQSEHPQPANTTETPDYSNLFYWAAHPQKKDPSDSIPKPLVTNNIEDKKADVFFIHPTTFTNKYTAFQHNANLLNDTLNKNTDYSSILYQASAFNKYALVYAPRYRQAHITNYYVSRKISQPYFDIAYADVKASFEYYLAHYNNGRPIVIASHSQGTEHAGRLLKEFFENKPLQKQLVAAYIIGMPVNEKLFTAIPACEKPDDIGCICSWRTMKTGNETKYMKREQFNSIVTNPITFTREKGYVSRFHNKGSVLRNFNKISHHVAGAEVGNKALFTPKLHFRGSIFFRTKNYHIADINLFYVNIRENIGERLKHYIP